MGITQTHQLLTNARTIAKANKVPETKAFVINLIKDGKLNKIFDSMILASKDCGEMILLKKKKRETLVGLNLRD